MRIRSLVFVAVAGLILIAISASPDGVLGTASAGVHVQHAPVTLSVGGVESESPDGVCTPGGLVVMRLVAKSVQDLSALSFTLQFDQDVATIPSGGVSSGGDIPSGWLIAFNPNTPGKLVIGMVGTTASDADGFTIAEVTFVCSGRQGLATNLTFSNVVAATVDEVILRTESVGGTVTIAAPDTITPPEVDLSVEATVDSDISNNAAAMSITVGPKPEGVGATAVPSTTADASIGGEASSPGSSLPLRLTMIIVLAVAVALAAGGLFWWKKREALS